MRVLRQKLQHPETLRSRHLSVDVRERATSVNGEPEGPRRPRILPRHMACLIFIALQKKQRGGEGGSCLHAYTHSKMYASTHVYMHACMHACMYLVCMYVRIQTLRCVTDYDSSRLSPEHHSLAPPPNPPQNNELDVLFQPHSLHC